MSVRIAAVTLSLLVASASFAQQWPRVKHPMEGVTVVYDDYGAWGGPSMGTSHQVNPDYRVRKVLDLSVVPENVFERAREARLLVYFAVQDYSWNLPDVEHNALDESFEIVVNGHVQRYQTAEVPGAKADRDDELRWRWHEFPVPLDELEHGRNLIEFRKSADDLEPREDYIYVGIDNTESHGHSAMIEGPEEQWSTDRLNAIDASGEYMVRLALLEREPESSATWRPGQDPVPLVGYIDATVRPDDGKLHLHDDDYVKLELDPDAFNASRPMHLRVDYVGGPPRITASAQGGGMIDLALRPTGTFIEVDVPASSEPDAIYLGAPEASETILRGIDFTWTTNYLQQTPPVNMAPKIAQPAGKPLRVPARCKIAEGEVTLSDSLLECTLQTDPALQMTSLYNRWLDREMLAVPERTRLFLLEIEGSRYDASDFVVQSLEALTGELQGFVADLLHDELDIAARLTMQLAGPGRLQMELELTNVGGAPMTFKAAFPHLGGLVLSDDPADDYYLFPAWGGIVASANTELRTAYGENTAWWQMIDLFSPKGGAGVMLRSLDETGLYKCPVLRKGLELVPEYSITDIGRYMKPEMYWQSSLEPGQGTAMAFEYLRRTRDPGESFSPPAALIEVHDGDWHEAMDRYAWWAHDVWDWRPHPSRLGDQWNIIATGWGQSPLYGEDGWRTDFFEEYRDCLEMMSWWEWSEVGPWNVPMDRIRETFGDAFYERYKSYWVVNPATGKLEYPLNRGDYDYNEDWGGLPALRDYVQQHYDAGHFPMFYMEGILCCDTTQTGQQYGEQYGVMNDLWSDTYRTGQTPEGYVGSYASWNMCSDTEWWPEYLAETVARVCRDTGVGGVRLDEYGHRGYVCNSDRHEHIFAEPGHNAWLQAVARACKLVHAKMDEVDPRLVLTTEFPGYDYMAQYLDGCIVYESMSHVRPIRPVPVNLFRFYFPECKVFDLDRNEGDSLDWQLFNAMARFGGSQPAAYYRLLHELGNVFESGRREPLVPTLHERVYANRFSSDVRELTMLYNARGFTVEGPLLRVEPEEGYHYIELLRAEELDPRGSELALKLGDGDVACVARFPERLSVRRSGRLLEVRVSGDHTGLSVALCDSDGEAIERQSARGQLRFMLPGEDGPDAASVKLLRATRLLDAAAIP